MGLRKWGLRNDRSRRILGYPSLCSICAHKFRVSLFTFVNTTLAFNSLRSSVQLMISSGILMSYFVDLAILASIGGRWRVMLGMAAMPAVVMMAACWRLRESPRWLAMKGRPEEAEENLRSLRKVRSTKNALSEINALRITDAHCAV